MKRTELRRNTPLKPGSNAQLRRTRLKKVGRRVARERKAMADAYQTVDHRAQGQCEARLDGCWHVGTDHHHVGPRSTHPHLRTDPTNIVLVCRPCHDWIGDNPTAAAELGLHKWAET